MPEEEGSAYRDSDDGTDADTPAACSVNSHAVPVVGVGASAGGIEAFTQLLGAMPSDSGAAFVLVLHLDPTRESQLSSILERHTQMPVAQVEDGMELLADHVYVIAPASDVTLEGDTLRLSEPAQPRGQGHPIDVLFCSLAKQRRERAVAIVLSGTGTNGTQGIKEIKAAGGLILVEDPSTARFDGMPRSAIGAGMADHVLAPSEMPATVLQYLRHDYVAAPDGLGALPDQKPGLDQLLGFLRAHSGQDFRNYKPPTMLRRVNRRMSLNNVTSLGDYIEFLRAKPDEVQALLRDLLISVTSFFRDEDAWTTLADVAIAQLVADHAADAPLRVWVPGCATGEEAYSIAMLLTERAEEAHKQFDVKVFASDVLDDNLNVARTGIYPGASVELLPPERIRRFFERLDGSYQVRKNLRDLVVFARQDLLRDPPFSRMDLISCRNLLIYIGTEAQKRILALFHFALREGGYLFLGSAETVGRADDLFETISKKWRIYRRVGATRHNIVDFPLLGGHTSGSPSSPPPGPSQRVTEIARRALLERFAPAAVLLDRRGRVLYFHGETGDYLKQPPGEPTNDLLAMAREGLLVPLRGALHRVLDENQVTSFTSRIRNGDALRLISVTLSPLAESRSSSGLVLVTFEPDERAAVVQEVQATDHPDATAALEQELRSTRADLQGTIERLESVNEELKAANEEATSMNEELQSTNEELETSKEELQSFNEELHSVNSQLQHKISELDRTSNDLANLLSGTEIATLFLDTELRIEWFSPATKQLLDLATSDIGRPIRHFARKFADERMLEDAANVLARLTPMEAEVLSDEGKWFVRRILPYRTQDNRISGLVITFVNITDRKNASDAVNEARLFAEAIVTTARQPLVVMDGELRVRSANRAFYLLFDTAAEKSVGRHLDEIGSREWSNSELLELLQDVVQNDKQFESVELALGPAGRGQKTLLLNARKLMRSRDQEALLLLAIEDITDRKNAARHQEMLIGELNHRVKNVLATVQAVMTQTLRQSTSFGDFTQAFTGRLHALAQAHDLLAAEEWTGTEIGNLVSQTLAPYHTPDRGRIVVDGSSLLVLLCGRGFGDDRPRAGDKRGKIRRAFSADGSSHGCVASRR